MSVASAGRGGGVHLDHDDYPAALRLVGEIARHRKLLGYEPTPEGAYIDWKTMSERVSATERAILLIAEGCAELERHGGAPLYYMLQSCKRLPMPSDGLVLSRHGWRVTDGPELAGA